MVLCDSRSLSGWCNIFAFQPLIDRCMLWKLLCAFLNSCRLHTIGGTAVGSCQCLFVQNCTFAAKSRDCHSWQFIMISICAHVPMSSRARTSVLDEWLQIKIQKRVWIVACVEVTKLAPTELQLPRLTIARLRCEVQFCTNRHWQLPTRVPPIV